MASVLEYLQDFFFTLFSRNPEEAERRRALRTLVEKLRQVQPPVYRRSGGLLLPAFGYNLLQLAYLLAPLAELFRKTLYGEDALLAERFRQHLAVARLPGAQAARLQEFGLEALRQRTLSSASPIKELGNIDQEFEQLLGAFSAPAFFNFDLDYTAMDRLASLCRHDLRGLFNLFEPGFDPTQKGRKPEFQPIPAKKALKELLDLYFILAGIELSEGVQSNLFALLDRLERERAAAARERMLTVLARLRKLLGRELAPELLATLIRVIQEDPKATPRAVSEEVTCLQSIRSSLQANFQQDRERVQREINENTIGGDLRSLFSGAEPLEVPGYNEKISHELAVRDYKSFARVKPLSIFKSFLLAHFEKGLRDPLKRLLIEGTFANRIFENMFNNTFYGCEGLSARLRQLEESLKSGSLSIEKIQRFLQLHDQGKPVGPLINKTVETIEQDVRKLVDEGCGYFYNLHVILGETLADAKQKSPTLVSNLRDIAGRSNKEYLAALAAAQANLQLFIKIMRNFTEIRENVAAVGSRTAGSPPPRTR